VVAVARDLPRVAAVTRDGEDLHAPGACGCERDVPAVGRVGRAFVGPLAERDQPRLPGGDVVDLDVVPGAVARVKGNLVVRGEPRAPRSEVCGCRARAEVLAICAPLVAQVGVPSAAG